MRTVFSILPIGQNFVFLGNPIVWTKSSDFEITSNNLPENIKRSALNQVFTVDAIVDVK